MLSERPIEDPEKTLVVCYNGKLTPSLDLSPFLRSPPDAKLVLSRGPRKKP